MLEKTVFCRKQPLLIFPYRNIDYGGDIDEYHLLIEDRNTNFRVNFLNITQEDYEKLKELRR